MTDLIKENKKFFIISAAVLYFLSAGVSYALFRATDKTEKDVVSPMGNSSVESGVLKIDPLVLSLVFHGRTLSMR